MKVSVITLFYNRRELSARFLEDWRRMAPDPSRIELLCGDSGSVDGTRDLLARYDVPGARVFLFPDNPGFARGNNRLACHAKGEVLVFINNDVVLCDGWLDELILVAEARPDAGVIGNVQLHVSTSTVHHAGKFFDSRGIPYHFHPPHHALDGLRWIPVPAVTGCCIAVRSDFFNTLRGFDEAFLNGYEDTDLCLRARLAGREILCATRSVIWHHVCSSPGRQLHHDANEELFLARHGSMVQGLSAWLPPSLLEPEVDASSYLRDEAVFQVFYPSAEGYSEANSQHLPCSTGRWTRLDVAFAPCHIRSGVPLRLDPPPYGGELELGGIGVRDVRDGRLLWSSWGRDLISHVLVGGDAARADDRCIRVSTTGEDPQLRLLLPADLAFGEDAALLLQLRLRVAPSAGAERRLGSSGVGLSRPARAQARRVLIDLWGLVPGGENGGLKVLLLELLRFVSVRRPDLLLTLVVQPASAADFSALFPDAGILALSEEDYRSGAGRTWAAQYDILYAPVQSSRLSSPYLWQLGFVVDLLHRDIPSFLPPNERCQRETWMVETLASSKVIQCNSRFVVERLHHHYGIDPGRCFVLPNALQDRLGCPKVGGGRTREVASPPYFIYPANDWPHKNHARLLAAYVRYRNRVDQPWDLVLTGSFARGVRGLASSSVPGVRIQGYLAPESFACMFLEASSLVFPSLYEGFGIPVLDAMAHGIPVACSRRASLPELAGETCLFLDPESESSIEESLVLLHEDSGLRARLSAQAQLRASQCSLEAGGRVLLGHLSGDLKS